MWKRKFIPICGLACTSAGCARGRSRGARTCHACAYELLVAISKLVQHKSLRIVVADWQVVLSAYLSVLDEG